jgi:hypothetical protein
MPKVKPQLGAIARYEKWTSRACRFVTIRVRCGLGDSVEKSHIKTAWLSGFYRLYPFCFLHAIFYHVAFPNMVWLRYRNGSSVQLLALSVWDKSCCLSFQ